MGIDFCREHFLPEHLGTEHFRNFGVATRVLVYEISKDVGTSYSRFTNNLDAGPLCEMGDLFLLRSDRGDLSYG